jgi:periplasmic copper chaperone A
VSRPALRLLTVAGAAALTVGLTALPALAHVTVSSPGATQGGYGVLTFRVPTESDTASTTGLKVQFPADQPLSFVSVKPKAGWTYRVTRAKLPAPAQSHGTEITDYTSVIEWKAAAGTGIKPGEFDEFQVSAGPLPEAESMTFKAIQTYSDGAVVSWIEEPAPGSSEEPEHPAPALKLAAPAASGGGSGATAPAVPAVPAADSDAASRGSVTGAYVLGGAGLAAGLAGLVLGLGARRRRATVERPAQETVSTGAK